MRRVRWDIVLILATLLAIVIAVARGYVIARCGPPAPAAETEPGASQVMLNVYDHREEKIVEVPLETYLVGVVAAEMPVTFHPEALKAQAVAARTYTLFKRAHGGCKRHGSDICTDSACCQAFLSDARMRTKWDGAYEDNLSRIESAVKGTSAEVLVYNGELVEALYHSSSGGRTENAEDAFSSAKPYLVSVMSTNESGTNNLFETVSVSRADFTGRVNAHFSAAKLDQKSLDTQIEIQKTSKTGRVLIVKLGGATATGRELRSLFGLNSTLFTLTVEKSDVRFDVRGYGHGVGMSQTGANGMGLGGRSYREILQYYYTGVSIKTWPLSADGG